MITYYHLQMTFIPSLAEQGKFFVWMTQPNGEPIHMSTTRFQWILGEAELADVFCSGVMATKSLMMEWDEEFYEVEGQLVDMWRIYPFLQQQVADTVSGPIRIGETFVYWETVARSIDALIQNGQYFPTIFAIAKDNRQFAYAQWMLARKALDEEGSLSNWLKSASPLIFAFEHLATTPIREWQNLMLDLWTDQVVKWLLHENSGVTDESNGLTEKWHHALRDMQPGFFHIAEEKQDVQALHILVREVRKWHAPLSSESYRPLEKGLVHFKQQFIETGIKPEKLIIHCEPVSTMNLMLWNLGFQLKGTLDDRTVYLAVDDAKIARSYTKRWVEDRIDHLVQIDDNLYRGKNRLTRTGSVEVPFSSLQSMKINEKVLASLDIEILYPEGWDLKEVKEEEIDVSLSVMNPDTNGVGLGSILEFDWRIAVGEMTLSVMEFKRLVEQQQFLIQDGQKWISLPARKLEKIYDELVALEPMVRKKASFSSLVGVKSTYDDQDKEIDLYIDRETQDYLQSFLRPVQKEYVIPERFVGTLRPYQQEGFEWLRALRDKRIGACLADDMGLGKTIQAIAYLLDSGNENGAHLIVCPTSVVGNWSREFERFAPTLDVHVHQGPERVRNAEEFETICVKHEVILTSYSLLVKDEPFFEEKKWNTIILDEAQMIKNPATKQSKAARKLKAYHRITLTGTPMENRLEELWSISDFLNPGYLGYRASFQEQFIRPIEKRGETERIDILKRLIQPFLLRRSKSQTSIIDDLPEKVEDKLICKLTKEQASLYQSVVDDLKAKLGTSTGMERRGLILGGITRLKQVCDHPSLLTNDAPVLAHSGKMQQVRDILQDKVKSGENVLLFTQYVKMGELLKRLLKEIDPGSSVFFLHGGVPSQKREELLKQFKKPSKNRNLFILSIKAGGVGLNLTEANHVIHLDRWWNPAVENQATDRAYRIGQQQNVQVYKLITKGTLEEGIDRMIERKSQLTSQIVTNQNQWVTELNDDEFIELIRLRERVLT